MNASIMAFATSESGGSGRTSIPLAGEERIGLKLANGAAFPRLESTPMPLLVLLFIVLPIAELYVIIQVGGAIGVLPTLAILVLDSLIGAALARSQSRTAWERFNRALAEGRVPGREVFDGAMIIVGGALLLTPGFITDVVGICLLLPPTRALLRRFLARSVSKRAGVAWRVTSFGSARPGGPRRRAPGYDYDGSAREVTEDPPELPDATRPGEGNG